MYLLKRSSISFCGRLYLICRLGFLSNHRNLSFDFLGERILTTTLMTEEILDFR